MTLGQYIKQYREAHGISQRKFALLSGLTNTYISQLENDKNSKGFPPTPSIETYRAVAKVAGISVDELVAIVEDRIRLNAEFTPQEESMIYLFRKASSRDRKLIMDILAEYDFAEDDVKSSNSAG